MSDPNISAIRAKLKFSNMRSFIADYSKFVSEGAIFIPVASHRLRSVGATVRFQLQISNGETALFGEGVVFQVRRPKPDEPQANSGMLLKFTKLTAQSKSVIQAILKYKKTGVVEWTETPTAHARSTANTANFDEDKNNRTSIGWGLTSANPMGGHAYLSPADDDDDLNEQTNLGSKKLERIKEREHQVAQAGATAFANMTQAASQLKSRQNPFMQGRRDSNRRETLFSPAERENTPVQPVERPTSLRLDRPTILDSDAFFRNEDEVESEAPAFDIDESYGPSAAVAPSSAQNLSHVPGSKTQFGPVHKTSNRAELRPTVLDLPQESKDLLNDAGLQHLTPAPFESEAETRSHELPKSHNIIVEDLSEGPLATVEVPAIHRGDRSSNPSKKKDAMSKLRERVDTVSRSNRRKTILFEQSPFESLSADSEPVKDDAQKEDPESIIDSIVESVPTKIDIETSSDQDENVVTPQETSENQDASSDIPAEEASSSDKAEEKSEQKQDDGDEPQTVEMRAIPRNPVSISSRFAELFKKHDEPEKEEDHEEEEVELELKQPVENKEESTEESAKADVGGEVAEEEKEETSDDDAFLLDLEDEASDDELVLSEEAPAEETKENAEESDSAQEKPPLLGGAVDDNAEEILESEKKHTTEVKHNFIDLDLDDEEVVEKQEESNLSETPSPYVNTDSDSTPPLPTDSSDVAETVEVARGEWFDDDQPATPATPPEDEAKKKIELDLDLDFSDETATNHVAPSKHDFESLLDDLIEDIPSGDAHFNSNALQTIVSEPPVEILRRSAAEIDDDDDFEDSPTANNPAISTQKSPSKFNLKTADILASKLGLSSFSEKLNAKKSTAKKETKNEVKLPEPPKPQKEKKAAKQTEPKKETTYEKHRIAGKKGGIGIFAYDDNVPKEDLDFGDIFGDDSLDDLFGSLGSSEADLDSLDSLSVEASEDEIESSEPIELEEEIVAEEESADVEGEASEPKVAVPPPPKLASLDLDDADETASEDPVEVADKAEENVVEEKSSDDHDDALELDDAIVLDEELVLDTPVAESSEEEQPLELHEEIDDELVLEEPVAAQPENAEETHEEPLELDDAIELEEEIVLDEPVASETEEVASQQETSEEAQVLETKEESRDEESLLLELDDAIIPQPEPPKDAEDHHEEEPLELDDAIELDEEMVLGEDAVVEDQPNDVVVMDELNINYDHVAELSEGSIQNFENQADDVSVGDYLDPNSDSDAINFDLVNKKEDSLDPQVLRQSLENEEFNRADVSANRVVQPSDSLARDLGGSIDDNLLHEIISSASDASVLPAAKKETSDLIAIDLPPVTESADEVLELSDAEVVDEIPQENQEDGEHDEVGEPAAESTDSDDEVFELNEPLDLSDDDAIPFDDDALELDEAVVADEQDVPEVNEAADVPPVALQNDMFVVENESDDDAIPFDSLSVAEDAQEAENKEESADEELELDESLELDDAAVVSEIPEETSEEKVDHSVSLPPKLPPIPRPPSIPGHIPQAPPHHGPPPAHIDPNLSSSPLLNQGPTPIATHRPTKKTSDFEFDIPDDGPRIFAPDEETHIHDRSSIASVLQNPPDDYKPARINPEVAATGQFERNSSLESLINIQRADLQTEEQEEADLMQIAEEELPEPPQAPPEPIQLGTTPKKKKGFFSKLFGDD